LKNLENFVQPQTGRPEYVIKGKQVKRTLVQALRLCTGRTAHRGIKGITSLSWPRH